MAGLCRAALPFSSLLGKLMRALTCLRPPRVPLLRAWCSPPSPWSQEQASGADWYLMARTSPFHQSHRQQESSSSSPGFAC